ncbi:MAG: pantetheine-phosphate adenylyltransferase [Firmicutes bacterium]|nr:pantetheine-phosphate adenylyltransferase [Bacillota bacterium]
MRTAVCPGSFDPITYGHLDVIGRAARLFDRVIVAVFQNPGKQPLFSLEERLELARQAVAEWPNVAVETGEGLLARFAAARGACALVKGLRSGADFDYEAPMAHMNARLAAEVDTVFLAARPEHAFISSSLVKEVAGHGGDVRAFVPPHVEAALKRKYAR